MPVATNSQTTDSPVSTRRLRRFLQTPKPPVPVSGYTADNDSATAPQFPTPTHQEDISLGTAASANSPGHDSLAEVRYFDTHSPPILNLSPNLSPSSEHQRSSSNLSPLYDWRETTARQRRPSMQGTYMSTILSSISYLAVVRKASL